MVLLQIFHNFRENLLKERLELNRQQERKKCLRQYKLEVSKELEGSLEEKMKNKLKLKSKKVKRKKWKNLKVRTSNQVKIYLFCRNKES